MKLEKILKITLVLQLLFLIFMTYPRGNSSKNNLYLSKLNKDNVSKITFAENDKTLTLKKKSLNWDIEEKSDFPANEEKVLKVLDVVFAPQNLRVVGKSKNAHLKYKLDDSNYVEKITLHEDGKDDDVLLIGDTPEFKKVYIRNQKSDLAFVVDLAKFEIPASPSSWYPKNLFGLTKEFVKEIKFPSLTITKENNELTLKDLPKDKDVNKDALTFLVNKLIDIKIKDVLKANENALEKPDFEIDIQKEDGTKINLAFKKEKDTYILKASNLPWNLEISKNTYNDLKENKQENFLTPKVVAEKK